MSLGQYLADLILEENSKTIALYPGAFKPPHKGHFEIVQRLSKVADEVLIIISPIAREGITAEQSLSAWKTYLPLLPKAKLVISDKPSPISYVYNVIKENPTTNFIVAFGKGEEARFNALLDKTKYPNVKVYDAGNIEDLSATNFRNALKLKDQVAINKFLPQGININDFVNAIGYSLRTDPTFVSMYENGSLVPSKIHKTPKGQFLQNIDVKVKPIKENTDMTFKEGLTSLTKYFVDKGYEVKPLPKVKIIGDDNENASKLLGKTAYYDPEAKEITLYTLNRNPKDVLRSFSHEMIHHIQNLRGDDMNMKTTDTNSSKQLDKLEEEAYLKGNMIFRNWEDNIKNNKTVMNETRIPSGFVVYCDMDGVLCDFEDRFKEFTGMSCREYENKYGIKAFWDAISKEGVEYWSKMPWMDDGKQLWDYIAKYNPTMLSAPSWDPSSKIGKYEWVKENLTPDTKVILVNKKDKQLYAGENKILIDDLADNINDWKNAGGIGILHKTSNQTINELKQLGL